VKNIPRPVRVYRLAAEGAPAVVPAKAGTPSATVPSERPSIAVLPFNNMSGDPEQEYFSDGITEDIITDLSKLSGLLVIARNSTFTCKGKPVDVQEVGKRFGVSHVLEGSVRRAGGRVRITAQLLEASSAHHVWAERYDRGLEDIFAVQDEITREIVAALDIKLLRGEQASLWRQLLRRPEALDAYYRGLDYLNRITREANAQAAQCFGDVLRLEPQSPLGHLGMAWKHLSDYRYGWSASAPDSMAQAVALAQKALELDPECADAHALLGYYHLVSGKHDDAIASGERSVALAPNHADNAANLACSYVVSGKPAEGVDAIRRAMRLSPVYPAWYLNILGFGLYQLGQHEEAEKALRLCLSREPQNLDCHLVIAAGLHAAGRPDAARREAQAVLAKDPSFRLAGYEARLGIVRDRGLVERFFALMRELGLQ
jgi:TolB-like protein